MKLFLTSSTITPELVEPFEQLIGKSIKGLKCIFIPDAAYGVLDRNDLSWVDEERQYLVDNFNWQITDVVLKNIEQVDQEVLLDADVVFANGGFSGYLANEMRRTDLDKVLDKIFEKDIVYVGSSAGSMVCSKTQKAAEFYIGEPEKGASKIPGLGLVDFELYPHFKEELREPINSLWESGSLYLLKDGEAISVEDEEVKILGEERIIKK